MAGFVLLGYADGEAARPSIVTPAFTIAANDSAKSPAHTRRTAAAAPRPSILRSRDSKISRLKPRVPAQGTIRGPPVQQQQRRQQEEQVERQAQSGGGQGPFSDW